MFHKRCYVTLEKTKITTTNKSISVDCFFFFWTGFAHDAKIDDKLYSPFIHQIRELKKFCIGDQLTLKSYHMKYIYWVIAKPAIRIATGKDCFLYGYNDHNSASVLAKHVN